MLSYLDLIEKTDVSGKFKTDTLLFPFIYGFYAANGYTPLTIPLVIIDMDISVLKTEPRRQLNEWKSENPFPKFNDYDFKLENVFNASVFCDTFVYNNIELYWTDETYVSNTNRDIENVYVIVDKQTIEIPKSTPVNISHLFDVSRVLKNITIKIEFSDGTTKTIDQTIYLKKNETYDEFSETRTGNNPGDGGFIYGDVLTEYDNFTVTHSLEWKTYYGCNDYNSYYDTTYTLEDSHLGYWDTVMNVSEQLLDGDQVLDKPYFFIMGWGPFTDKGAINSAQNWPTPMDDFYATVNHEGLVEGLREAGYDVIIVRLFPPNASVVDNADLLIELIKEVNTIKNSYYSYEENIAFGKSSGSLGTKLALLKMEYEHLNNNGPHHQTKLYVSNDGEQQGANIPLGWQGCIKYLKDNHSGIGTDGLKIYALNFILNATQTKELVKYHYTTVMGTTPERQTYLNAHLLYNHSKNQHIANYPAFCRNISASSGAAMSDITGNFSTHPPFHGAEAQVIYHLHQNNLLGEKFIKAQASRRFGNTPFFYEKRPPFGSWSMQYQITTDNTMLNIDNANGGGMFEVVNANHAIADLMIDKFGDPTPAEMLDSKRQYCFTPTLFTHDIRNYDYAAHNYLFDYNFYEKRLLFNHEDQALIYGLTLNDDDLLATNFYGYPHLGHSQNHYNYTPFDALFLSADVNTEHLSFNYINGSAADGAGYNSPTRAKFKNWVMTEADYYNTYIQNKKYGYNARSNYTYKAHINSPHTIFIGNHVTQRTDFKAVEVQQNAELICKAADQIVIKPGFKTEQGAKFVAKIQPYGCSSTKAVLSPNSYSDNANIDNAIPDYDTKKVEGSESEITIYPNPTTNSFTIKTANNLLITYQIFTLQGKMVKTGTERIVNTNLPKGVYIVKVAQNENTTTHKLIIK